MPTGRRPISFWVQSACVLANWPQAGFLSSTKLPVYMPTAHWPQAGFLSVAKRPCMYIPTGHRRVCRSPQALGAKRLVEYNFNANILHFFSYLNLDIFATGKQLSVCSKVEKWTLDLWPLTTQPHSKIKHSCQNNIKNIDLNVYHNHLALEKGTTLKPYNYL